MNRSKIKERLGEEKINYQGCLMKIIKYIDTGNIIVEFQDDYKAEVSTEYKHFLSGSVKNPYYPSIYGIGIVGNKYLNWINNKAIKEYDVWKQMLRRCFDKKTKEKYPTYKNVTCCKEWLLYENFYEWLHSQKNFGKWYEGERWELDKDILVKGNKIYSSKTCCLVPHNVNTLFTNHSLYKKDLPIGITKNSNGFCVRCNNLLIGERIYLGTYKTIEESFNVYKQYKEDVIKQVAEIEYSKGNITKQCYEAMMNYEVEIDD